MRRVGEKRRLQQSSLAVEFSAEHPPPAKRLCSVPNDVEVEGEALSTRLKGVLQGTFQSIYRLFGAMRSMLSWSSPAVMASQQQSKSAAEEDTPLALHCKPSHTARPTAVTSTPCAGDPPFLAMSAEAEGRFRHADEIPSPAFLTTKQNTSKRPGKPVSAQDTVKMSPGRSVSAQDTVKTSLGKRVSAQCTVRAAPASTLSMPFRDGNETYDQADSLRSVECGTKLKTSDTGHSSVDGAQMLSSIDYGHPGKMYTSVNHGHSNTMYSSMDHRHLTTLYSSLNYEHSKSVFSTIDHGHPRTLYSSEDHEHPRTQYSSLNSGHHKGFTARLSKDLYSLSGFERQTSSPRHHTAASSQKKSAAVLELPSSCQSSLPLEELKDNHAVAAKYDSRSSSWREWMKNFKLEFKHSQDEQRVMMEAAKAKLKLHQQKRMEQEDKIVEQLRRGLAHTYVDSEDEEEEDESWCLSSEQQTRVSMAISRGSQGECLSERYRIRVTRADLRTLTGSTWLNDEVINFYFNLISECCKKEKGFRVHVFNSFFYAKLSQSGYGGVRRWTKKVNLFEQDLILLPVHLGMHWCLAAIDFRSHEFVYYDSLLGRNPSCLARLREYLVSESMDKRKVQLDLNDWRDHTPQNIPRQENGSDCGVFTCMFARHKAWQLPFKFSQDDMQDIRQHMIYEILEQTLV